MQAVRLQVRHTLDASGRTEATNTIYCPFTARCVSVADCTSCQHARAGQLGAPAALSCVHPSIDVDVRDLRKADRIRVGHVMTRNVFCVQGDVPMQTVIQLMDSHGFSGMPVVDERGRPQGVVSRADVIRLLADPSRDIESTAASDAMSARAICVEVSTSLSMAAALMAYQGIHRVPVIDQDGAVVGVLASIDVLRWLGAADGYLYGREHTAH